MKANSVMSLILQLWEHFYLDMLFSAVTVFLKLYSSTTNTVVTLNIGATEVTAHCSHHKNLGSSFSYQTQSGPEVIKVFSSSTQLSIKLLAF